METGRVMSRRSVSPGEGFKHFGTTVRADGRPDGFHTGGVWLTPDETEVYKPLTAWPCANATKRYPTDEAKCLSEMSGQPGFLPPDAWRIVLSASKLWLVMPRIRFWPQDMDILPHPSLEDFLAVEEAVKTLNAAGWEYNDPPQLAYYEGKPVLMDFSNAHKPSKWIHRHHGDGWRMAMWWERCTGRENIAQLRRRGFHVHHAVQLPEFCSKQEEPYDVRAAFGQRHSNEDLGAWKYIYAATEWDIPEDLSIPPDTKWLKADGAKFPTVYAWVVSLRPLTPKEIKQYQLTMAWTPWP